MIIKVRPAVAACLIMLFLMGLGLWLVAQPQPASSRAASGPMPGRAAAAASATAQKEASYFPAYRIQREKARSQQLEMLREVINNPNTDEKSRQLALERFINLAAAMEKELKAEGLLKAEGFDDAAVILEEGTATVIVSGPPLSEDKDLSLRSQLAVVLKMRPQGINIIAHE